MRCVIEADPDENAADVDGGAAEDGILTFTSTTEFSHQLKV